MKFPSFKAGKTFSYAGVASGLDPDITWGAVAAVAAISGSAKRDWPALVVTLTQSADYGSTHNYDITLFLSSALTHDWRYANAMQFDVEFFNTAAPDPVLFTETVTIPIEPPVTWRTP